MPVRGAGHAGVALLPTPALPGAVDPQSPRRRTAPWRGPVTPAAGGSMKPAAHAPSYHSVTLPLFPQGRKGARPLDSDSEPY